MRRATEGSWAPWVRPVSQPSTPASLAADVLAGRLDLDTAAATWRALNPPPPGWPFAIASDSAAQRGPYVRHVRASAPHPCTACGEPATRRPGNKGWRKTCGAPACIQARRIAAARMACPGPRPRGPARP